RGRGTAWHGQRPGAGQRAHAPSSREPRGSAYRQRARWRDPPRHRTRGVKMDFDLGNMAGLLGGFQTKIAEMQAKQKALRATGKAGGGLVSVVATGEFESVSVTSTEEACQDRELLEELVRAATDEALRQVRAKIKENMPSVAG